ncbi:hypothetical protein PoB_000079600 [Plakobranchus ocellatus]|uniref:Uncharacterized protein n=1 Tax=Plakobranchus ocellatus TaxID=259542 RepID=A0AAV3XW58_9GAST|nr:hypothetical protein PoB_000079600 [Plakobranchus ocellatus]
MGQLTSRQEILSTEVSDPQMRNWLCANMAIRETSQAIAIYLHRKIAEMHKTMQRSISQPALCRLNCSQRVSGTNSEGWCSICERWALEIRALCEADYRNKLKLSRLNSSQWPENPYEVARAFIPKAHRLYYKAAEFHEDLRFSLSLIENCKDISVPRSVCEQVWQSRGRVRRKNVRMRLSRHEMEGTLSSLLKLLSYLELGDNYSVVTKLEALLHGGLEDGSEGCFVM